MIDTSAEDDGSVDESGRVPGYVRVLLESVQVLHARGYESIAVYPTFYATGHWRCSLHVLGRSARDDSFFLYSSGGGWDYFGDSSGRPTSAELLADRLLELVDDRKSARRPAAAYRFWYAALLRHCGADRVPYLYSDYENCEDNGYVGVSGHSDEELVGWAFPLPPA